MGLFIWVPKYHFVPEVLAGCQNSLPKVSARNAISARRCMDPYSLLVFLWHVRIWLQAYGWAFWWRPFGRCEHVGHVDARNPHDILRRRNWNGRRYPTVRFRPGKEAELQDTHAGRGHSKITHTRNHNHEPSAILYYKLFHSLPIVDERTGCRDQCWGPTGKGKQPLGRLQILGQNEAPRGHPIRRDRVHWARSSRWFHQVGSLHNLFCLLLTCGNTTRDSLSLL